MKTLTVIILLLLVTGGALGLLVWGWNQSYESTLQTAVQYPLSKTYTLLTNFPELSAVMHASRETSLAGRNTQGLTVWQETTSRGRTLQYEYLEQNGSNQVRLAAKDHPFFHSAEWIFSLTGSSNMTFIAVTQKSRYKTWWKYGWAVWKGRDNWLRTKLQRLEEKYPLQ